MRLRRIRLTELRQFRAPVELAGLDAGLNVITGPNEAGKSTFVRAIRAAFFERHRSSSVEDLRPSGDTTASPAVELEFELDGATHVLSKSFLHKKRCELLAGERRLEGSEAEDYIAERFGFQFAQKGASREEHWGIPGLLWIEQGSAQDVREPVGHARDHLRAALSRSLGEVAATDGDEVWSSVQVLRSELLTATGRPRASYLEAIERVPRVVAEVTALQDAVNSYRDRVDRLRALREAHARDVAEAPWVALQRALEAASAELRAATALTDELQRTRERHREAQGKRELLAERLRQHSDQGGALAEREVKLAAATDARRRASDSAATAEDAWGAASAKLRGAHESLLTSRRESDRRRYREVIDETERQTAGLVARLRDAEAAHVAATRHRHEAVELRVDPHVLAALRKQGARQSELRVLQEAVATRLRYDLLPGVVARFDDDAVGGRGERLLLSPTTVEIPGIGALHIAPGGRDLEDLERERAALEGEHRALLQRLGQGDLAQVEARVEAHGAALVAAATAEREAKLLAPHGLDALRDELHGLEARRAAASTALVELPPAEDAPPTPLDVAEREHEAARSAAEAARERWHAAREALARAVSEHDSAQRERDALRARLTDPALLAEVAEKQVELVTVGAIVDVLRARLATLEAEIEASGRETLALDVERLQRSANAARDEHRRREVEIVKLEAEIQAKGGDGLEEQLALRRAECAEAQRRLAELQRRAEALAYLSERIAHHRDALIRRLQAPLRKHLDRYLRLLFGVGSLQVLEDLTPGALIRAGASGEERVEFDTLSFGAREQLGVLVRLAYADLLREAGRPTLIILDDALVHSDPGRLGQMKRVLYDAAQRHQVLLFTCHPGDWRDAGVPLRALPTTR